MNKISLNLFLFFIIISGHMQSQDQLPFKSIPQYPDNYKSGNIIQRMIQGLGYRYYWATEGLTDKDLKYRPVPPTIIGIFFLFLISSIFFFDNLSHSPVEKFLVTFINPYK